MVRKWLAGVSCLAGGLISAWPGRVCAGALVQDLLR